ncbi:MAG: spore maturation protein CgeB [Lachnospiraceae bacterium]|uniref:Glycosyltransferase n=1 Tax=Candidatus Weimeria bifida TaxID=2599074 RepID=A0A6N7J3E1_9FIRM|nr:glycosyltransferase [Candidatus Weimeria bifida]RRF97375.1 MAG: spore maturation protein CgeB [Lachnospiraceae bacterium]
MKVIFVRYGSLNEPDIIATFKEFGIEVIEYSREVTVKNDYPSTSLKLLNEFVEKHPCDFLFSINFFPYVSELANIYHLRYISWVVDAPVLELYTRPITNKYNRTFIFDRAVYNEIHPLNPDCVFHLPLAGSVKRRMQVIDSASEEQKQRFSHEIAFVGSLYSEKDPYHLSAKGLSMHTAGYIDGILKAQESVYGYFFIEDLLTDEITKEIKNALPNFPYAPEGSFLTDKRTVAQEYLGNAVTAIERDDTFKMLSEHFDTSIYTGSDTSGMPKIHNLGLAKSLEEMPIIFHESKININTTSKTIRTGLPQRIFDITSCGGFCISNYQEEIPELFVPGEEIVMYESLDELRGLCAYYLEHDERRREIAYAGFEKTKNNYTYETIMQKLLYTAFSF